jgi:hypothetical protein
MMGNGQCVPPLPIQSFELMPFPVLTLLAIAATLGLAAAQDVRQCLPDANGCSHCPFMDPSSVGVGQCPPMLARIVNLKQWTPCRQRVRRVP